MSNLIEIKSLSKNYRDFKLDSINLTMPDGYIMGFVGPNGAGKSTTIKLMLNLISKDGGEIKLFGLDSVEDELAIKQRIGFVLDDTFFHGGMTADDVHWLVRGFYKRWDSAKFLRYLEQFELPRKKKIKEFSAGMKAKLSLAIALSHEAELLILDEPTSGLDPIVRDEILSELFAVVKDGRRGVFFSTHITSDLEKVADYVTFINRGRIVLSKSRDKIDENYRVIKAGRELLSQLSDYILGYRKTEFGFYALTDKAAEFARHAPAGAIIEKATIEDIMLYYVKGETI